MAHYSNPRFQTSMNQGVPLVRSYYEANSQSFVAGQLVYIASAGAVTACASDSQSVLGIALKDATNVTSGNILIPVQIIRTGDEYEIDVYQGSTDDDAAVTQLGQNFALNVTSNSCKLDLNDTGHDLMTLQKIVDADGKICVVTFIPTTLQYHVGY